MKTGTIVSANMFWLCTSVVSPGLVMSNPAYAADEINAGDTVWVLVAAALVLSMMIPGLALLMADWCVRRMCYWL